MTAQVAHAAFPKGNVYLSLRDKIGQIYQDKDFASLYPKKGQPSIHPWRLALVCVMQYMEDLSDRQAADAVRSRIDWKYLLGLELSNSGFNFSVLSEFRERLHNNQAEQQLLSRSLEDLQQGGWLKARGKQRTDSTHVLGKIRDLNRLEMVGEMLRASLNAIATIEPEWLQSWVPQSWFERYGKIVEEYRLPKSKAERQVYGETIGADGMELIERIWANSSSSSLRTLDEVERLRQTWVHQYFMDAEQVRLRSAADLPPSGIRLDSPYDADVRYGNKRSATWKGYKVHITETCDIEHVHLITHVETTPAHVPDIDQTAKIHRALEAKSLLPHEHFVDAGYVDTDLLVSSLAEHKIQLIGPVRPDPSWQAKVPEAYDSSRFDIDWNKKKVTCPAGKVSTSWCAYDDPWGNPVISVHFSKPVCRICPVRELCTQSLASPRSLTLHPHLQQQALLLARQQQQTTQWKKQYNTRAGVEGTISQGVAAFGLRQARYIGLLKTQLQHVITAVAFNFQRMADWLEGTPHAKTRISRFAALALEGA
jgi:transposase